MCSRDWDVKLSSFHSLPRIFIFNIGVKSKLLFFYKHLQFFWRGNLWSEGEKRWVWGGGTSNGCIYRIPGVNYICSRAKLICNLCTTFMAPTQELAAPCLLEARAARDRCSDFLSSFSVLKMHQLSTSLKSSSKAFFKKRLLVQWRDGSDLEDRWWNFCNKLSETIL